MRVIVAGGRGYRPTLDDLHWLRSELEGLGATEVIEGGCRGVDDAARRLALDMGIDFQTFWALWDVHGTAAGPIRNRLMAEQGDCLIAFPGGAGTHSMIREARLRGLPVIHYDSRWSRRP